MKLVLILLVISFAGVVQAQNEKPLEISELAPGVYLHKSFKFVEGYGVVDSNGLVVIDGQSAYIIDTPWSQKDTALLLEWMADKHYKVVASISTHSHEDRTAGIGLLNSKSIPTYTSSRTKALLAQAGQSTPAHVFEAGVHSFDNGNIELFYPGEGHTEDNLVAWLPKHHILFGGCLVRGLEWKSLGNIKDASIAQWAQSVRNVQSRYKKISKIVPGHGVVGNSALLDHTIDLAEQASAAAD